METSKCLSVLQVCSASQAIYGAVQSLMTLARVQREAGNRVEFLTFAGKRFGAQVMAENFAVHEVKVQAKIDPRAILRMRKVIRDGGFDLVHTHLSTSSVNGCIAARFAKVPSVATVHGMSGKLSFSAANHLIAVSEEVKRHLVGQGVRADKVSVVHNGLAPDFHLLSRKTARENLDIPESDLVVGTVSRVTPKKGIEDALQAIAKLRVEFPNIRYLVVGDGDGLEHCRALADELGLGDRAMFVGYQQDVGSFLPAMDVFLFPTHKEAMGIALVEAMAAGLPCVATDVGGIPEVVTTQTGRLVPSKDPPALERETASLLRDLALREHMSRAALERCRESFSAAAMERSTDWIYREVLGQTVPAQPSSRMLAP
jgi:glycosyltransferase involved in cell wall biosynthesis